MAWSPYRSFYCDEMMMIAFITFKSSLVPLFEGLWSSNSWEFEVSGFRRNRTDDLGIDSPSLWPTEPRSHVRSNQFLIDSDENKTWSICAIKLLVSLHVCRSLIHTLSGEVSYSPASENHACRCMSFIFYDIYLFCKFLKRHVFFFII